MEVGLWSEWVGYAEFWEEFVCTFEPMTDAKLARQTLEGFK